MATEVPQTTAEGTPKARTAGNIQAVQAVVASAKTEAQTDEEAHRLNMQKMEAELKAIELENAKLEAELKKANLVDTRERLADRELKREALRQEAYTKGATIKKTKENEERQQSICNHKKGGNGAQGIVGGQGDDSQYAVLKHRFANGDVWVRCLRCGKTWKPPVKSQFVGDQSGYERAVATYREALNFQTRNIPSAGVIFQYSDAGEYYREQTANSNLR